MLSLVQKLPLTRSPETIHLLALASLLSGAVVLAFKPVIWLVGTWHRAGYDGVGWMAAVLVLVLFLWSWSSPRIADVPNQVHPMPLLLLAALLRLLSQILDINVIGALLLGVDVYALAGLAGLAQRRRRIAPFWLAVLFCFSLPIEPMAQRLVGYDLQLLSANLACTLLWPFVEVLHCEGIRLVADGRDVLVDLPCSGAEMLSLTALVLSAIHTLRCPGAYVALFGALAAFMLGLFGNSLRIVLLALGIVHAEVLPFHVMDPLPHTVIGLVIVALVSIGLYALTALYPTSASFLDASTAAHTPALTPALSQRRARWLRADFFQAGWSRSRSAAFLFLPGALLISALQPRPVDVAPPISPPEMPLAVAGFLQRAESLTPLEQNYFEQYGGSAARAAYGPFGLLLVSTASPLRHLHDPTICLSGAGFDVRLLGTDHATGSTLYRAQAPQHHAPAYLVRVSYISNHGERASSVAEVVWRWLRQPQSRWTMVQRVVPEAKEFVIGASAWHQPALHPLANEWDLAVRRAFNI